MASLSIGASSNNTNKQNSNNNNAYMYIHVNLKQNRRTVHFTGPPTRELLQKEFEKLFYRDCIASGSCYFQDSDSIRWEHYQEIANGRPGQRNRNYSIDELKSWSEKEREMVMFPPGFQDRFNAWKNHRDSFSITEPFLFDSDHWPGQTSSGSDFPPLLTHGNVLKLNPDDSWQLATPREHLRSLGFRSPSVLDSVFQQTNMPIRAQKKMAGNGMHLFTMTAWMTFVMSFCVPKSEIQNPEPQPYISVEDSDEDEWADSCRDA